ncbi:MAG: bifunctional oligoribonuclease/PAP phosphatase NrnA [Deltaproteobacteria bacterium]|jgi:phosphoesterase RecJ-like protein|nr:bifunctional oligoribonuclease/PAP phosphatase NrnA [Deltaproteobacteria bacterium]
MSQIFGPDRLVLETIRGAERILVMGHENPDGDALGSSVALVMALERLGREATLGYQGRVASHLAFLAADLPSFQRVRGERERLKEFDLMIMVDCLHPNRIWPGFSDLSLLPPLLIIDHHPGDPRRVGPVATYHSPLVSSTGELMFKLIEDLGISWRRPLAEALLAAIMSDTGFFSQSNATAECYRQASVLVAAGARSDYLVSRLRRNRTLAGFKLLMAALATLEIDLDGRLGSMLLSQAMLDATGASLDDAEGFVEYPRSLAGVEVAALFRVDERGQTRVSLRSALSYSVRELAENFGGGGHQQAAAYTDPATDPAEARARFLAQAPRFLKPL